MNTEHHSPSPGDIWKDILVGNLDEMFVCGPCGRVVGTSKHPHFVDHLVVQGGYCPKHRQKTFIPVNRFVKPRSPGMDPKYRIRPSGVHYDLCHCCGAFPIKNVNGSNKRFCSECEDEVRLLNARLGRCAVPTAYYTGYSNTINASAELLADLGITTPPELSLIEKEIIEERYWALRQAARELDWWSRTSLRLNLRELGWDEDDSAVPIANYLSLAAQHIDKADRFRKMCMDLNEQGLSVKGEREFDVATRNGPLHLNPDPRVPKF